MWPIWRLGFIFHAHGIFVVLGKNSKKLIMETVRNFDFPCDEISYQYSTKGQSFYLKAFVDYEWTIYLVSIVMMPKHIVKPSQISVYGYGFPELNSLLQTSKIVSFLFSSHIKFIELMTFSIGKTVTHVSFLFLKSIEIISKINSE